MNAIIVDDEKHAIENLSILLTENFPQIKIVGTATKILEAIALIHKSKPAIAFLDISMTEGTNFDLLNAIEIINFHVVFVTAYDEYAIEAIKHNAFDYLLKPLQLKELKRCIDQLEKEHIKTKEVDSDKLKRICINTLESTEFIKIKNIIYCKSDNSYTTIYLKNGRSILSSKSIKNIENTLPTAVFKRAHNSFLINKDYAIKYLKKDESIELSNGVHIPLSRSRKEQIIQWLGF